MLYINERYLTYYCRTWASWYKWSTCNPKYRLDKQAVHLRDGKCTKSEPQKHAYSGHDVKHVVRLVNDACEPESIRKSRSSFRIHLWKHSTHVQGLRGKAPCNWTCLAHTPVQYASTRWTSSKVRQHNASNCLDVSEEYRPERKEV